MTRPRRAIKQRRLAPVATAATSLRDAAAHRLAGASGYVRTGAAAIAIATLGLTVTGAITLTSSARAQAPDLNQASGPQLTVPSDFSQRTRDTSRGDSRPEQTEQERHKELATERERITREQAQAAAAARAKALSQQNQQADAAERDYQAHLGDAPGTASADLPLPPATGQAKMVPLKNYTLTGRFGEYGPWARWHTGNDLAAPIGTPIYAATSGVVTHVGFGDRGAWAGFYIVILHPDGYSTLYAHQNPSNFVKVGQLVNSGEQIGIVGLTGRTFGPHCHVELYPPGAKVGDIYTAINIFPWLKTPSPRS